MVEVAKKIKKKYRENYIILSKYDNMVLLP